MISMRGDRRIRPFGQTNSPALGLPRSILGVKITQVLGVLTSLNRTILLLKPAENKAIFPFDAPRVVMLKGLSHLAASDFTIGGD